MAYYGALEVVDRAGWVKTYPLEKALLMIGSADFNDIVLPEERGLGIAPAHLQVMRPAIELGSIHVVNLSAAPVVLLKNGQIVGNLPGGGTIELNDGDGLMLAEFHLTFAIQSQGGIVRSARSEHMGLRLELPGTTLRPFKQLAGRLTVTNYGSLPRCQFELELEGLPSDCYRIDPAPLLFPHGESQLQVRFFHRGSRPAGGLQALILRANAPGTYPVEEVTLDWNLDVTPLQSVQMALDEETQAPWERGTKSPGETRPMPVVAPKLPAPETQPATAYTQPIAEPPLQPHSPAPIPNSSPDNADADKHLTSVLPTVDKPEPLKQNPPSIIDAQPPAEAEWWQNSTPPDIPVARTGATRRPRPKINGQNIPVLRISSEPVTGADPTASPTSETEEEAQT